MTQFTLPGNCKLKLAFVIVINSFFLGCSFVELKPGARHVVFANDPKCELVSTFEAKTVTENIYIERSPKAIQEELQVLAQNAAFEQNANAIWPTSEIKEGTQIFKLMRCR